MSSELEKDLNDEVYEDSFYDNEEELTEEEVAEVDVADDDTAEEAEPETKIPVSFACDDCDYRWDDVIVRASDEVEDDEISATCPMCGSNNVTQI